MENQTFDPFSGTSQVSRSVKELATNSTGTSFSSVAINSVLHKPSLILKFSIVVDETKLQESLRLRRKEVYEWVDKFWRNHNYRFKTEKDEFILKHKTSEQETVPADKMSEFYKDFLDKNWKVHVFFNLSWYIKNFELLILAIQVNLQSGFRKLRGK